MEMDMFYGVVIVAFITTPCNISKGNLLPELFISFAAKRL